MNNAILNINTLNTIDTVNDMQNFLTKCVGEDNIKIKSRDNQMIFAYSNYFYKFTVISQRYYFQNIIRQIIAEIYREEYGLHWEVFEKSFDNDLSIVQIIEKEKVEVCENKTDLELAEALGKILCRVEQKLNNLDFIVKDLQKHIKNFSSKYTIKLMRLSQIKNMDYGITKEGKIILLDDSDFYFVLYNKEKENVEFCNLPIFIVSFKGEEYYFTSIYDIDDYDYQITQTYEPNYRFQLIKVDQYVDIEDKQMFLQDQVFSYYNNLIKYIDTKQNMIENQNQYKVE